MINSPNCLTCLFSSYGMLIMVGFDFSQTRKKHRCVDVPMRILYGPPTGHSLWPVYWPVDPSSFRETATAPLLCTE